LKIPYNVWSPVTISHYGDINHFNSPFQTQVFSP
jgi:hypothetical protein